MRENARADSRLADIADLADRLDDAAAARSEQLDPALGLPWVLFGSAVMRLHGIRDAIGDVDVFAAPVVWNELLRSTSPRWTLRTPDVNDPPFLELDAIGTAVHVFYAWTAKDPEVDAIHCRRTAELVDGWPCAPLQVIRMHKAMAVDKHGIAGGRQKHRCDVLRIDGYLRWAAA